MEITNIYALKDPITKDIRYIGKANNVKVRYYHHCRPSKMKGTTHSKRWICSLIKRGLKPILEIVEVVSFEKWQERESYWIKFYKETGCNLCNHTDGGEGLSNCSEETKEKIRANNRKNIAIYRTPEFRKKISELSKKMIRTPEHCEKIRQSKLGKKRSAECIKAISDARKGKCYMTKEQYPNRKKTNHLEVANNKRKKKVARIGSNGEVLYTYNSLSECSKKENILNSTLSNSIIRKGKAKGKKFIYL